jgi:hypothetical protein
MVLSFEKAKQTRPSNEMLNDPRFKQEIIERLQKMRAGSSSIPALLFAQLSNVCGVMPAVPRVEEQQPVDILQAGFGMAKLPGILFRRDGSQ